MLNREVFEKFGTENWVIEENLCYLLQKYAEKLGVSNPYNPVTFVKNFMKEETYVNTTYAEMSAIDTAKKNIVAGGFIKRAAATPTEVCVFNSMYLPSFFVFLLYLYVRFCSIFGHV